MLYDQEIPQVYSAYPVFLDILTKPITWFKPYMTGLGQMILYRLKIKPMEEQAANDFHRSIIRMNDGTELLLAVAPVAKPLAVVLYLHTVCGDYTQLAHTARVVRSDNFAYVSYTRSGNDSSLRFSKFNFVGNIEELKVVIDYIEYMYPGVPIHAIGASAGSALLIRYLGGYNESKKIKSAVLVSPGYHFLRSMRKMNIIYRSYLVNKMKYMIRHLPCKDELALISSLEDWITFQSKLNGYASREEYEKDCDPVNYLHKINVPSLFISSLDDGVFDGDITKQYTSLPSINPNIVIVITKRGGHVMFEDVGYRISWFLRVAREWILKHV